MQNFEQMYYKSEYEKYDALLKYTGIVLLNYKVIVNDEFPKVNQSLKVEYSNYCGMINVDVAIISEPHLYNNDELNNILKNNLLIPKFNKIITFGEYCKALRNEFKEKIGG